MSIIYTEAFDNNRLNVFNKLSGFADEFVLAGGTAIMLLINHRKSFDFDLFSNKPLKKTVLQKARKIFGSDITVQIDNSDILLLTTSAGIKIDFVYFPYSNSHELVKEKPISIFSLKDLSSNKAYTIGRRATWRDYVDIFFLIKEIGLKTIIKEADQRFDGEFNEKLFLEQLTYFEDLEIVPIEFIKENISPKEIQEFLKTEVKRYTSEKLVSTR